MTNEELLVGCANQTVEMVKQAKVEMCRDQKGKSDFPPFVVFGIEQDETDENTGKPRIGGAVCQMELENGIHPADELPFMLSELHGQLHEQGVSEFVWLMFMTEGYARQGVDLSELPEAQQFPERGELEKEFAEKADTNVVEGIVGTLFAQTGEAVLTTCFYKYDDNCIPVYQDTETVYANAGDEHFPQGLIAEIMTAFIKYSQAYNLLVNTHKVVGQVDNPLVGDALAELDPKNLPNFITVWQVANGELPDDKKQADLMKQQAYEFMSHAFLVQVTHEVWGAIKQKGANGEIDLDAFMAEMEAVMTGNDDERKQEYITNLTNQYSVSVKALMLATGRTEVPNDISGLMK